MESSHISTACPALCKRYNDVSKQKALYAEHSFSIIGGNILLAGQQYAECNCGNIISPLHLPAKSHDPLTLHAL